MLAGSASRSRPSCHSAPGSGVKVSNACCATGHRSAVRRDRRGRTVSRRDRPCDVGRRGWARRRRRARPGSPPRWPCAARPPGGHLDPERSQAPSAASVPRAASAARGCEMMRRSSPAAKRSRAWARRGWAAKAPPTPPRRVGLARSRSRRLPATTTSPGPSQVSRAPGQARRGPRRGRWWPRGRRPRLATIRTRRPTSTGTVRMSGPGPRCRVPGTRVGGLGGACRPWRLHLARPGSLRGPSPAGPAPRPRRTVGWWAPWIGSAPAAPRRAANPAPERDRRTMSDTGGAAIEDFYPRGAPLPPPEGFADQAVVADASLVRARRGTTSRDSGPSRPAPSTGSTPWHTVLEWDLPFARWFVGGTLERVAQLPRPPRGGRARRPGRLSTGRASPATPGRSPTPSCWPTSSASPTCSRASACARGDRVAIYMPMIPELPVAMLACTRIGAAHSVVFGGFSPDALRDRINDAAGQGARHRRRRVAPRRGGGPQGERRRARWPTRRRSSTSSWRGARATPAVPPP